MYCRGQTQQAIADYLELTRQQISYDLKIIFGRWRESATAAVEERKAAELEKINQLERTYWDAWERSLKPKESTRTSSTRAGTDRPDRLQAETRSEQRNGNPSYLAGVQWCIDQRCKILGINAPVKLAATNADGTDKATINDDDRNKIIGFALQRLGITAPGPSDNGDAASN